MVDRNEIGSTTSYYVLVGFVAIVSVIKFGSECYKKGAGE